MNVFVVAHMYFILALGDDQHGAASDAKQTSY